MLLVAGLCPAAAASWSVPPAQIDLGDTALRDRIAGLKATRDQAQADSERAQAMLESSGQQAITP